MDPMQWLNDGIKWLNDNAGAIQGIVGGTLVAVTAVYVVLTFRMLRELRRANRPYVSLDFEIGERGMVLVVTNIGSRGAWHVEFDVQRDIEARPLLPKLATQAPIARGIRYLAPGRRLLYNFAMGRSLPLAHEGPGPSPVTAEVAVRYHGDAERRETYDEHLLIDLSVYNEVLFRSFEGEASRIARTIERLEGTLKQHLRGRQRSRAMQLATRQQCPHCQEPVSRHAELCPHCHLPIPHPPRVLDQHGHEVEDDSREH